MIRRNQENVFDQADQERYELNFSYVTLYYFTGRKTMLWNRWCGTPVYQRRDFTPLFQAFLEPQDGFGQTKLSTGKCAVNLYQLV